MIKNCLTQKPVSTVLTHTTAAFRSQLLSGLAALVALLCLPAAASAQEVTDNFNTGTDAGWQHYTPTASGGAIPTYTFPTNGPSDLGYRLLGPTMTCDALLQRGSAYRSETYAELFYSVDLLNYATTFGENVLFGCRIGPPGALAPLSINGNMIVYGTPSPGYRQGLLANLAFSSEVIATFVDGFRGGAVSTAPFPPSRQLRVAVSADTANIFRGELYDRTDLLEPLARITYQDYDHGANGTVHPQGENWLGWLNLSGGNGFSTVSDITFDNYHATASKSTYIGFPGQAQVVNLVPKPQTLFYTIPSTNQITFTVTTFAVNQINTNQVKLFLNDVEMPSNSLAFTEVKTPIVGASKTNFSVRWNGTLASNTVYHGQIRALDTSGKGTTNNWYFDTFTAFNPTNPANPSGFLLVEAEDYNYNSGQFQNYPLVSGTDDTTTSDKASGGNKHPIEVLGPQVNGSGVGYYDGRGETNIVGVEEVDYHTNPSNPDKQIGTSPSDVRTQWHQYRDADRIVTTQGTKGGGFDTPRSYRSNLVNNASGTSYVPDYIITDMDAGDWMNYTRTFPNTNYQIYLRVSSEGRQDVRLDEVTGDRTLPNQTVALRGQFLVPNTESWTRWRYVPLTDGAGNVQTLGLGGIKTLRLTANEVRRTRQLIEFGDLQLNWMLFVPTNGAPSSGPYIASAKPSKNSAIFDPAGTVQVVILDRGTAVVPGSIQLRLDGVNVTGSSTITPTTTEGPGTTVSYVPGFLLPNSTHNLSVVFGDGATTQSNYWSFTVDDLPMIPSSQSLTGAPDAAFTVQVHKGTNDVPQTCNVTIPYTDPQGNPQTLSVAFDPFEDGNLRAEQQLAGQLINSDTQLPFPNEAMGTDPGLTTNGIYLAPLINFEQCGGNGGISTDKGFFTQDNGFADTNFPGILPSIYCQGTAGTYAPNHYAVAASIKLLLAPGVYRMGVNSEREFKVTTGPVTGTELFLGASETLLSSHQDGQFEFAVQSYGLYRLRMVMERTKNENEPGWVEWYWVNRTNGTRTLISPTPAPALSLYSSTTVNGTYTNDLTGVIDTGTKTVTVPKSGTTHFYKLSAASALNITNVTVSGGNVVLKYQ